MPVIALCTQKGGSGKSTLATNLATVSAAVGKKTIVLDLDPQKSATKWWDQREDQDPEVMAITGAELEEAALSAKAQGFETIIIDTPGRDAVSVNNAMRAADLVLVPCRPSPGDMSALGPTVDAIRQLERPFAFILNQTPPRSDRQQEGREALAPHGPVLNTSIVSRAAYQYAHGFGQGVIEYEPNGKAAEEIQALWNNVSNRLKKISQKP